MDNEWFSVRKSDIWGKKDHLKKIQWNPSFFYSISLLLHTAKWKEIVNCARMSEEKMKFKPKCDEVAAEKAKKYEWKLENFSVKITQKNMKNR